jgi:hypothetical protein
MYLDRQGTSALHPQPKKKNLTKLLHRWWFATRHLGKLFDMDGMLQTTFMPL